MSILQMSFSGAVLILAVVVLRTLLMNRLPKDTFLILWGIVLFRLLVPLSVLSELSVYAWMGWNMGVDLPIHDSGHGYGTAVKRNGAPDTSLINDIDSERHNMGQTDDTDATNGISQNLRTGNDTNVIISVIAAKLAIGLAYQYDWDIDEYRMYFKGKEVRAIYDTVQNLFISTHVGIGEGIYADDAVDLYVEYDGRKVTGLREATPLEMAEATKMSCAVTEAYKNGEPDEQD